MLGVDPASLDGDTEQLYCTNRRELGRWSLSLFSHTVLWWRAWSARFFPSRNLVEINCSPCECSLVHHSIGCSYIMMIRLFVYIRRDFWRVRPIYLAFLLTVSLHISSALRSQGSKRQESAMHKDGLACLGLCITAIVFLVNLARII